VRVEHDVSALSGGVIDEGVEPAEFRGVERPVERPLKAFPPKRQAERVGPLGHEIIDLGTGGVRVVLVVPAGELVGSELRARQVHPRVKQLRANGRRHQPDQPRHREAKRPVPERETDDGATST
jgi:hypothetical protein